MYCDELACWCFPCRKNAHFADLASCWDEVAVPPEEARKITRLLCHAIPHNDEKKLQIECVKVVKRVLKEEEKTRPKLAAKGMMRGLFPQGKVNGALGRLVSVFESSSAILTKLTTAGKRVYYLQHGLSAFLPLESCQDLVRAHCQVCWEDFAAERHKGWPVAQALLAVRWQPCDRPSLLRITNVVRMIPSASARACVIRNYFRIPVYQREPVQIEAMTLLMQDQQWQRLPRNCCICKLLDKLPLADMCALLAAILLTSWNREDKFFWQLQSRAVRYWSAQLWVLGRIPPDGNGRTFTLCKISRLIGDLTSSARNQIVQCVRKLQDPTACRDRVLRTLEASVATSQRASHFCSLVPL